MKFYIDIAFIRSRIRFGKLTSLLRTQKKNRRGHHLIILMAKKVIQNFNT